MVTRNDVARRAGTSTAVVSYVVNDGPRPVAPATRARVLAAVAELGYRPNAIARSLRAARSNTIGVLLEDHAPRSAALLAGAESVATDHDVTLVIGTGRSDADGPARQVRAFVDRQADGLLLLTREVGAGVIAELARSKTPSIEVFPLTPEDPADAFVDEAAAVRSLLEHLAEHGRLRVLFASSTSEPSRSVIRDRPEGRTVQAEDLGIGEAVWATVHDTDAVDAIVCGSVATAVAVQRVLDVRGTGGETRPALAALSDDLQDRHAEALALTVAGHPWEQIGALAAQTLLDRIRDPATDTTPIPTVAPRVRCRSSCEPGRSAHRRDPRTDDLAGTRPT